MFCFCTATTSSLAGTSCSRVWSQDLGRSKTHLYCWIYRLHWNSGTHQKHYGYHELGSVLYTLVRTYLTQFLSFPFSFTNNKTRIEENTKLIYARLYSSNKRTLKADHF